tara:strand:- start:5290 stop:6618 length:1329 start_codon:yes stop_codon:yes gene_type:complete
VLPASRVTTAAGVAGGTTIQCDLLNYRVDDTYNDTHWAILPNGPSGSGTLEVSRISDFDQLDGSSKTVITVYEAFSAQVGSGVSFYVSPIHPESIRIALNNATSKIYPWAFIPRVGHHVSNSRIQNGFWDYWDSDSAPTWWKKSHSALTLSKGVVAPYHGKQNLRAVADSGGARYIATDPVMPSFQQKDNGETITLHAMIYAVAGSSGGVSIQDGNGVSAVVYHSGVAGWEEVETAERTILTGTPANPIEYRLNVAASATVEFGPVWTEGGEEIEVLHMPPQFRRAPSNIREGRQTWPSSRTNMSDLKGWRTQSSYPATHPTNNPVIGNVVEFDFMSRSPHLLTIEGEDYIEEATLETDVYAVDAPQDELLYMTAILELKTGAAQMVGSGGAMVQAQLALNWEDQIDRLIRQPAFSMTSAPKAVQPMFSPPLGRSSFGPVDR